MPPLRLGPVPDVAVLGAGASFPEAAWDNAAVLRRFGGPARSEEHLAFAARGVTQSLGLETRRWVAPPGETGGPTTPELAAQAARAALADAGLAPGDLAALLVSTSTPHRMTGTVSAAVGAALGTTGACQDLRAGCAGGLFALAQGALLAAASGAPVLVCGVETFSRVIPRDNANAALALGDGAAALVLAPRPGPCLRAAFLRTDGALAPLVHTPGPLPPQAEALAAGDYTLHGDPESLAAALPPRYAEAIDGALAHAGLQAADIDLFLPHQTSRPLVLAVAARAGVPDERTWRDGIARHANIGAAGALAAFTAARAEGRLPQGTRALLAAVGGGLSWAAVVLEC